MASFHFFSSEAEICDVKDERLLGTSTHREKFPNCSAEIPKGRGGKAIEKRPERHSITYQSHTQSRVLVEAFQDVVSDIN
jgi:hypothetical protein